VITGVHAIIYGTDAEATRAFFRDVLELPYVDAHGGWLTFALPPAELAAHPAEEDGRHELYLMCDDLESTITELESRGVEFTQTISDMDFGRMTALKLPGAGELFIYEPDHASPLARSG
jgi:catechol 2,3-dioxygenase-like lactoylglutathione lyase family enzyme